MNAKVSLAVVGIAYGQTQTGGCVLILEEVDGKHRIPIAIPLAEAQAIAMDMENIQPYLPHTYDLFSAVGRAFELELLEVCIVQFENGIFTAELLFYDGKKQLRTKACVADAIALAMRFQSPVYMLASIIEEVGIAIEEAPDDEIFDNDTDVEECSCEALRQMLEEAVSREDYETASMLRDELRKRGLE